MPQFTKQIIATVLLLVASLLLFLSPSQKLPLLDTQTNNYFKETITEATLAYATVRGVNAVISVLKESEVAISPAGIGLTIAAGQILDPIDDMTERLSSVLVVSIVSLGLQKIINDIGGAVSFRFVAILLPFFILPVWINNKTIRLCASLIARIIALAAILRILLPLSSIINNSMYQHIFLEQIREAQTNLSVVSSRYNDISSLDQADHTNGLFSKITKNTNLKIKQTKEIFSNIVDNAESIVTSLIQLTILYVTLFITQIILIPMFMLWLLIKIIDTLLMTNLFQQFTVFKYSDIRRQDQRSTDQDPAFINERD